MQTGSITIKGSAGHFVGAMMSGGSLIVNGDVGNYAGANLTGEMEGMGRIPFSEGNAETIFVVECEEGLLLYRGTWEIFCKRYDRRECYSWWTAGKLWGYGMRRGTIIFRETSGSFSPRF